MTFLLEEVQSAKQKREFLDVARCTYQDDANWVCPPDRMVHNIFERDKNNYYAHGDAARWVLKDVRGKLAGRIAAFVDERPKKNADLRTGGIGFFECVDDQAAADLLFGIARGWLTEKGVAAMDGPINFGENDRFWGLMVEGFSEPPFTTNYHPPYYQRLFEAYGFQPFYDMVSNVIDLQAPMDERFLRIWEWVRQKEGIEFRHPQKHELEMYAQHFRQIYNEAWQFHEEYKPITEAHASKFAKEMKHLFISEMMPFAFVRDEPAGFLICTPDLNQVFKPLKGKIGLWQQVLFKLRSAGDFRWYRDRGILTRGHAIAIGIKPKFQQYGLETGMMMSSIAAVKGMGFKSIELRWAGDFNPKISRLHHAVGAVQARKHITYRYLFDRSAEFRRYTPIPMSRGKVEE